MHPATHPTVNAPDGRTYRTPLVRRRLLRGLLAAVVALPLVGAAAACGDDAASDGKTKISVFWWGGEARAQLTEQALDLYTQKNPDVVFEKTWQANQGYFDKLATLTAGGNPPDIFQIDDNYLTEYAARNTTLDLTPHQESGKVDTSKFPQSLWQYGVVDGQLAGLASGENTQGLVYNKTLLTKNGLPEPTTGMSWEEHIAWAEEVSKKTGVPGTMDASAVDKAFWVWLRQQGKDLYKGNDLGFTVEDVTRWFELWKDARDRGATPTPDVIHEGNATDITKQLVVTGKAATSWVWVNQMPELKKNTTDELGVIAYPGDPSGQWARASMYWSVFRGTKNADIAVDVINFLVNDPEAVKLLGTDRGLPSNLDLRRVVSDDTTDEAMKQSIAVETELAESFGESPQVPIKGHSKVRAELIKSAENAQYGRATPAEAAAQFVEACKAAIAS
ncbi:multiple sugar transport system substrate-binding protein [Micromonospora phaseoli]|uniref:Multiple sugar transport system substrate-binding protein n=1 Tax=Micromonospora phaseoli TaxID=1144548 RepID=A0A1H6YV69_9ACTN|nr:extracellular solute-binding protein [Micromonospora phaseoli]PZW00443.1 multiple sugar transport system substrate-binding protein [Micromonospora phaseoli]GIJ76923.1 sugar ABC transporter substrate-binding protein [Micromonospora phaseoli]SEJ45158.1 multiple sugar transport system substrate-binding protein [Micromonospora phaseoli]